MWADRGWRRLWGTYGSGGAAGAITISTCTLATPPASFTPPPRGAPLVPGGNPVAGLVTLPRPRIIDASDASNTRLYTVEAIGGGGGMPGGSGLSLARCSQTGAQCFTDGPVCPLALNGTAQICLPVTGGTGSHCCLRDTCAALSILTPSFYTGRSAFAVDLGLGGLCDYSSAAVLLDFNKQVLYAKDRRGSIVAWQLVAISKDNHLVCFHIYPEAVPGSLREQFLRYLVCFHIYPEAVPGSLREQFLRYDVAFAKALGLTLGRLNRRLAVSRFLDSGFHNRDSGVLQDSNFRAVARILALQLRTTCFLITI